MQRSRVVDEEKTHLFRVGAEYLDFLGCTFGRYYSHRTGRTLLGRRLSKKSGDRLIGKIRGQRDRKTCLLDADEKVKGVDRMLGGWDTYFCLGRASKAYNIVDWRANQRLRGWLCSKHKVVSGAYARFTGEYRYTPLGFVNLAVLPSGLSWAKALACRRAGCVNRTRPLRGEGCGNGTMVHRMRPRCSEGVATIEISYRHHATFLLYWG